MKGHPATLWPLPLAVEQPAELLARLARHLGRWCVGGRKLLAPVPGLAGVDERHGMRHVADRAPLGGQRGIGARVPRARDELDRFLGIGAREHRPKQVIEIGDVDIVVDHHDVFRGIGGGAALRCDVRGLHRVARIALRDRERVQHARAADLVAPHLLHAGHARIGDVLLDGG